MKNFLIIIVSILLISGLAYGGWQLKRWFNYSFGYESDVENTVKELVKPECLKARNS
jgi:hypothetical protein